VFNVRQIIFLKVFPLSSKLENSSKLAHPGESRINSLGFVFFKASKNALLKVGVTL
jgi:hypothetical protein